LSMLENMRSVKLNHIFFRGDSFALQSMLGGEIAMVGIALGSITDQPVRPLAILGSKRVPTHPDLPTGSELGYPIVKTGMVGFFAPKGLPDAVRQRLDRACATAARNEQFLAAAAKLNQPVDHVPGPEWERNIAADARDNKDVIERLGLKAQN
jgi:tripartite-type tricarboxylate transporter receptor subunit TctC